MRQVRTEIELREGVKVGMLFTPRLYMFAGTQGATLSADTGNMMEVYSLYADVMFCAALNLWTLEGKSMDSITFSRADFHEYSAMSPEGFAKALNFALLALTGKSMEDFIVNAEKAPENAKKQAKSKGEDKKKDSFRLTTWLSRIFS